MSKSKPITSYFFEAAIAIPRPTYPNPITATLDTLRPTLLVGLLNSASANMKVSQKRVSLFESGTVFTSERYESKKIGFISSGPFTNEKIS